MDRPNLNILEQILEDWDKSWEMYKVDDNMFEYMFNCASLLQRIKDLYENGQIKYKP